MKKHTLLSCSVLLATLVSVPAFAASSAPVAHDWRGGYAGIQGGYGFGSNDTSFSPLPTAASFVNLQPTTLHPSPEGGFFGIHTGYNWQDDKIVYGAVADFDISGIDGSTSQSPIIQNNGAAFAGGTLSASQKGKWLASLRGRGGYAICDKLLVYGTGGLAVGEFQYKGVTNFRPTGTTAYTSNLDSTQVGWVLGAGAEYALDDKWSLKTEYLHYDFGKSTETVGANPSLPPFQVKYAFDSGIDTIHVGLSYKFY